MMFYLDLILLLPATLLALRLHPSTPRCRGFAYFSLAYALFSLVFNTFWRFVATALMLLALNLWFWLRYYQQEQPSDEFDHDAFWAFVRRIFHLV